MALRFVEQVLQGRRRHLTQVEVFVAAVEVMRALEAVAVLVEPGFEGPVDLEQRLRVQAAGTDVVVSFAEKLRTVQFNHGNAVRLAGREDTKKAGSVDDCPAPEALQRVAAYFFTHLSKLSVFLASPSSRPAL